VSNPITAAAPGSAVSLSYLFEALLVYRQVGDRSPQPRIFCFQRLHPKCGIEWLDSIDFVTVILNEASITAPALHDHVSTHRTDAEHRLPLVVRQFD